MSKQLMNYAAATLLGGLCLVGGTAAEAGWYYGPDGRPYYVPDQPYNPYLPYGPLQQQGWWEGQIFYQTGLLPNHRMLPPERAAFLRGDQRAASVPWQSNAVRQQGYAEGQNFVRYGMVPGRPMSPAEWQGFTAGERRALYGR